MRAEWVQAEPVCEPLELRQVDQLEVKIYERVSKEPGPGLLSGSWQKAMADLCSADEAGEAAACADFG